MKSRPVLIFSLFFASLIMFIACGDNDKGKPDTAENTEASHDVSSDDKEVHGNEIKEGDVQLTNPLDQKMVAEGKATYDLKCQSCHKLTDEKLVGPGWKDVTKRRTPVWIMNMITNVDMMLEKDPEAQKLLEQCLVRMPNQNISKDDARELVEFMRSNDGEK
jgi:cytochrome c5